MSGRDALPPRGNPAAAAITLACAVHGYKRGLFLAGAMLGIQPDSARKLAAGVISGASIPTETAIAARLEFSRQRAAQLRAELHALELHDADIAGDSLNVDLAR
jgi:hypothetical protein